MVKTSANVSFGFNGRVVHCLTTEKTEGTAEGQGDHLISPAVKS